MIVVDEYLAVRALLGDRPGPLDGEALALTVSRHWRLLQRIHAPGRGQLSSVLAALSPTGRDTLRHPHPDTLTILDPRPLLDDAAAITARYGGTGLLVAETLAAGLAYGAVLWFGIERNVGRLLATAADDLGIAVHVAP